jgi:LacI family transcriptional regulator
MATMADVARAAGVSPATVSRVVNGTPYTITPALRERVLAAVAELGYVPNAHAQALARSNNATVGVIVHDVSDPYFSEITRGLQRVASEGKRLVIICNSYWDPERELAYVDLLRANRVEALILVGSGFQDEDHTRDLNQRLARFAEDGGRVVTVGRRGMAGDAVMPDNVGGGQAITETLFALGHRNLGVVAGPANLSTVQERLDGVRRAAAEHGLEGLADRVVHCAFSREGAAEATWRLLEQPNLDAIVALNDVMALGVLAVLRERGVRVPEDVSVTGFDDMPITTDVTPPLTTVRLPMVAMGARAMALAVEPGDHDPRSEHFPADVIIRSSTRPR